MYDILNGGDIITKQMIIRNVIEDYVEEHDISAYIDDLWDRIGNKLRSKGLKPEDIEKVIEDARRNKA